MKFRFLIAIVLLILLSTYNFRDDRISNKSLNINEIILENNTVITDIQIKNNLAFLYETNLFFLNTNEIETKLKEIDLIKSFIIKKIYPKKIKIIIFEKKPIAILQNKKIKYFYTSDGETTKFLNLEKFKNLPIVFGDKKNFKLLYNNLKDIKFPINEIKTFFFFESKRWDLITKKDQTIKLPINNYTQSLKNFKNLRKKDSFEKYKIFDYRINGQLILK